MRDGNKPGRRLIVAIVLVIKVVTETLCDSHEVPTRKIMLAVALGQIGAKVTGFVGNGFVGLVVGRTETGIVG